MHWPILCFVPFPKLVWYLHTPYGLLMFFIWLAKIQVTEWKKRIKDARMTNCWLNVLMINETWSNGSWQPWEYFIKGCPCKHRHPTICKIRSDIRHFRKKCHGGVHLKVQILNNIFIVPYVMVDQLSFSKRFRAEETHLWCFVLKFIPSPHLRGHLDSICLSLQMDDECSRWGRWKGIPVLSCSHYVAQWSLIFCCCTRHLILIGRLLCVSGYCIRGQEINDWKKSDIMTGKGALSDKAWKVRDSVCVNMWRCDVMDTDLQPLITFSYDGLIELIISILCSEH